jgi:Ca2+-binding RTX toxin-like protein
VSTQLHPSSLNSFTYSVGDAQEISVARVGSSISAVVNLISGTAGNDQLIGTIGNDEVFGGAGDDQLVGGAGNDVLIGGVGSDTLFGGAGQDLFILTAGEDPDTIADFMAGVDSIQFAGGLTPDEVSTTPQGADTLIQITATGELLAILIGAPPLQIIDTPDASFIVI